VTAQGIQGLRSVRVAVATLALGLLAGCTPDRGPPAGATVVPPPAWRNAPASGSEATLNPGWWNRFGDPVLTSLVEQALRGNPDMAIAAERVLEARAEMRLSLSTELPHVDGGGLGGRYNYGGRLLGLEFSQYILGGALRFDTDLFGRLREQTQAARARMLSSIADRDAVALALVADTVRAYIALRSSDATRAILQETLAVRQGEADRVRHQVATGYMPVRAANQADASASDIRAQIAATQLRIARQEDALSVLLGEAPDDRPAAIPRGRDLMALTMPPTVAPIPAHLLAARPDLISAADRIVAADHALRSARAAFLPDIVLDPNVGTAGGGGSPIAGTVWALSGSVLAPIFTGGALTANEHIARSQRNQAAWGYRHAAIEAFREVDDALAGLSHLSEQENHARQTLDDHRHTLANAQHELREGYVDYFDMADAQDAALAAQLALIEVHASRLAIIATLYQAVGGGWRTQ